MEDVKLIPFHRLANPSSSASAHVYTYTHIAMFEYTVTIFGHEGLEEEIERLSIVHEQSGERVNT